MSISNPSVLGTVYGLLDPRDHVVRYVGITTNRIEIRFRNHLRCERRNHRSSWIKSLAGLGLKPRLLVIEDGLTREALSEAEQFWIALFRSAGAVLLNRNDGGWIPRWSLEARRRLSARMTGRKLSPETIAKVIAAQKGVKKSEKARASYRISNRGRVATPETRAKMSAAHLGRVISDETRVKIRSALAGRTVSRDGLEKAQAAWRGCSHTDANRKKISEGGKGQRRSTETRARISAAVKLQHSIRRAKAAALGVPYQGIRGKLPAELDDLPKQ